MRDLEPALSDGVVGGYRLAEARHVRPDALVSGLVARPLAGGVDLRAATAVVGNEHAGGRVSSVSMDGGRIEADAVVVCAGAWTLAVPWPLGVRLPIQAGKGYGLDYGPPPELAHPIRRALYLREACLAVTPLEGMVRLAGTMELSGLNHRLVATRVAAISRPGARYLRGWPAEPTRAVAWTGPRPLTPDGLPVIG